MKRTLDGLADQPLGPAAQTDDNADIGAVNPDLRAIGYAAVIDLPGTVKGDKIETDAETDNNIVVSLFLGVII